MCLSRLGLKHVFSSHEVWRLRELRIHFEEPMMKWVAVAVFVLSLVVLFPLSIRIADPYFTRPYEARFKVPVLLVFPEHVEVRWVTHLAEVAPPPNDASYTFAIPANRQQWVEQQIRNSPPPRPGSFWKLRIHQLNNDSQRIDLEARRDGFTGLIYDAQKDSIIPVAYRSAGPSAALLYLLIDVGLSSVLSTLVCLAFHFQRSWRAANHPQINMPSGRT